MLKRILRPTNRRIRLLVGLFLAGLFCIQCTRTEGIGESTLVKPIDITGHRFGENSPEVVAEIEQLAKTDHIALLERCLANYEASYQDFTCTFIKEEVIRGEHTGVQEIQVKHTASPFRVVLAWTKNAPLGDRVIYEEGKRGNMMLVRPRGKIIRLIVPSVLEKPDGPRAMSSTLRPVNMFGFGRGLKSLIKVYRQAKAAGDMKTSFGGYARVGGDPENGEGGRNCVVLIRYLPPKDDYPAWKTLTYIDVDYLLPICVEGYDWDENLQCRYIYKDLKFNVGLTEDDFSPEANGFVAGK